MPTILNPLLNQDKVLINQLSVPSGDNIELFATFAGLIAENGSADGEIRGISESLTMANLCAKMRWIDSLSIWVYDGLIDLTRVTSDDTLGVTLSVYGSWSSGLLVSHTTFTGVIGESIPIASESILWEDITGISLSVDVTHVAPAVTDVRRHTGYVGTSGTQQFAWWHIHDTGGSPENLNKIIMEGPVTDYTAQHTAASSAPATHADYRISRDTTNGKSHGVENKTGTNSTEVTTAHANIDMEAGTDNVDSIVFPNDYGSSDAEVDGAWSVLYTKLWVYVCAA